MSFQGDISGKTVDDRSVNLGDCGKRSYICDVCGKRFNQSRGLQKHIVIHTVNVNFTENGRGGNYLLHAGFKFSIRTRGNDRVYWKCVQRQCPATITTLNNIPVNFGHDHNHPGDTIKLAADVFINEVKQRCREEVCAIPTIFEEALGKLRDRDFDDDVGEMISKIPTFESCKASLYRARSKTLPKLPSTQQEVDLQGAWKETLAGERFLLCDDTDNNGHRIMVFATDDNLSKLCDSTVVFGDGTFYCPGVLSQMYSLHGYIDSTVFPLVFALLPNKTEQTYRRLFTLLRDAVVQMNLVFAPETVMLDFEVAARNAMETVFPAVTVRACFFHYTQCIWRKVQGCGLAGRYRQDDELKTLIRRAAVLPLVPLDQVEDVWFSALDNNDDISPEATRFKDYVTETWVEGQNLALWNHYDNDGPRITNHVEGWHSKVNKLCNHAHPNIVMAVHLLKKIQASDETKIIQLSTGGKPRPKKRKYRHIDSRLSQLKDRYRNGQIDVLAYADAASHLLHLQ